MACEAVCTGLFTSCARCARARARLRHARHISCYRPQKPRLPSDPCLASPRLVCPPPHRQVDPIFVGGHWTPQLVDLAGGAHPLNPCPPGKDAAPPSFAVQPQALVASDPDWIVICPCGLDIDTTIKEAAVSLFRGCETTFPRFHRCVRHMYRA